MARPGLIHEMTGADDPYEVLERPDIRVDTVNGSPKESTQHVFSEPDRLGGPVRP